MWTVQRKLEANQEELPEQINSLASIEVQGIESEGEGIGEAEQVGKREESVSEVLRVVHPRGREHDTGREVGEGQRQDWQWRDCVQ